MYVLLILYSPYSYEYDGHDVNINWWNVQYTFRLQCKYFINIFKIIKINRIVYFILNNNSLIYKLKKITIMNHGT